MVDRTDSAAYARRLRSVVVGFVHVLRLLVWLIPYCIAIFGGVWAESLGRRLLRASDWIYERARVDEANNWKDGILGR